MTTEVATPMDRGLEPARRPFLALERAKRQRGRFIILFSRARTPGDKLNLAMDYFRVIARNSKVDPVEAATITEHLAHRLIEAGDQLTTTIRRWP